MKLLMKLIISPFKVLVNKNFFPILLVLFFATLAARHLIFERGYFMMHDDLQMMRQLEMEKCFKDGQIPCRWTPDMAYGYGFAMFNFYPPLPYLAGQIIRSLGFTFVETVKITFTLSIFLSGIFMYLFSKKFFGRIGGLMSSVFYIWAPYHSVDVYVRGAMNEAWALTWFPLICYSAHILIDNENISFNNEQPKLKYFYRLLRDSFRKDKKYIMLLALSWSFLLLSHNLMVMIFTPVFLGFMFLILWQKGKWYKIISLVLSAIWALGISSFFTLPALFENKFTQVRSVLEGYYDYTAHFVSIGQLLFSRFWGYGPSVWGVESDGMPFQIGIFHWTLSLLVFIGIGISIIKNIRAIRNYLKNHSFILVTIFFLLVGWSSAFMTHQKSAHIWVKISQLEYLQFPWRFLTITIFAFSFIVGVIPGVVAKWKMGKNILLRILVTPGQLIITLMFCFLLVIVNWQYFRPNGGRMGLVTDEAKFSGLAWELQQTSGIYDYLPVTSKIAPNGPKKVVAEVMEGQIEIKKPEEGSYFVMFDATVFSESSKIRINTLDFPNWRIFANEKELEKYIPEEEKFGRFWVSLPKGEYKIYAQFFNTPVRTFSNIVSLVSITLLVFLLVGKKKAKING